MAIGSGCKVQFRGDVLGAARYMPVSMLTDSIDGAEVSLSGKLVKANHAWVVVAR